jgi:HEAT repeat protein
MIGDIRAVVPLQNAFQDKEGNVRRAAAMSLLHLDRSGSVDLFIHVLQDEQPEQRVDAAWALGEAGESRAKGALLLALQFDEEGDVRMSAAKALKRLD